MGSEREIAVTGATGALGGRVAARLAEAGVPLRLVVRDPSRAPRLGEARVAVATYAHGEAMRRALTGVGTLFLVSAEEAVDRLDHHRSAVAAAADAGVERVVYTSFLGAAPDATFTLARDHFHTERALRDAGLATVVLRNSLYMDVLPYFGADGVIRGPAGQGRFAPVARDDIADVAVAALVDPGHDGAVYDVTGPEALTMGDVAQVLSEVTGRSVRYEAETTEQAYASREPLGAPEWAVTAWVTSYAAIAAGEMDVVSDAVERVAGHPPMSLREYLRTTSELPRGFREGA